MSIFSHNLGNFIECHQNYERTIYGGHERIMNMFSHNFVNLIECHQNELFIKVEKEL